MNAPSEPGSASAHPRQPGAAAAMAHPNIALIKYWGKRASPDNLPAVGSLSITLDTLQTQTSVHFESGLADDCFVLNGQPAQLEQAARLSHFLDRVRRRAGIVARARVRSTNNFPTGAGLASSASGFAALALAASEAAGLTLSPVELSILARQGSGSAARSIFAGFVEMSRGEAEDGHDSVAQALFKGSHWPLRAIVAIADPHGKAVSSTQGMQHTRDTAPYYAAWLADHPKDLHTARRAIAQRDFASLATVAEHSCMKMHALTLAAQPPLVYWSPMTLAALQTVMQLRQAGVPVFFTVDAGPQVIAVCLPQAAPQVHDALRGLTGIQQVMNVGLGGGVQRIAVDQGLI